MPNQIGVVMSWSGGKDSCLALYEITREPHYRIDALLTTITRDYDRVSMHGVRRTLLDRQAASLGLPLHRVLMSKDASNEEYERQLTAALVAYRKSGIDVVAFGDLFLEDVRAYREQLLARIAMKGLFPVWHRNTDAFVNEFLRLGFKAIVTCVDREALSGAFAGRVIDEQFLNELPSGIDPCGENGEFHTFVFDGPLFRKPVKFSVGESVVRGRFCFRDLIPT